MSVGSENRAHAAFEMMGHEVLVGGRLGMHVHDHTTALAGQSCQDLVSRLKRAIHRSHEGSPQQAEDGDRRSISSDGLNEGSSRRVGGKVGRLAHAIVFFQDGNEFLLLVDMIA